MLRTGLTFMCVVFLVYPVIGNPLLELNVELACILFQDGCRGVN